MTIRQMVKLNIFSVIVFLLIILFANYWVSVNIEKNINHGNNISEYIFLQDEMNGYISDLVLTKSSSELNIVKNKFENISVKTNLLHKKLELSLKKTEYYNLNKGFFSNVILKNDFDKLLNNKNDIANIYEVLYELQNNKIKILKGFSDTYPNEKKYRKIIRKEILSKNNMNLLMSFNAAKYYSKEALFQYKDEKHFSEWENEVKSLKEKIYLKEFDTYLGIVSNLRTYIFQLNNINQAESVLSTNIEDIRRSNRELNRRVNSSIENISRELSSELNNMLLLLILFVIITVMLLGYKIYNNIGLSVDETKAKIDFEISENRKKDELLSHQSKLVAMGEMMGNIAHQWRQPLNALAGNVQFLREDFEDGSIDEKFVDKYIKDNMGFINFMSKTIDDFRNFFQTDKIKADFSILKCIEQPINILRPQLKEYQIDLDLRGDDFMVHDLQSEFQQVILNIVNNAKDALLENKINNPKIKIETSVKDSCGFIIIQDNAGGIPDEVLSRVFEPYFTTKEQGKGTGIGLFMSKMIVVDNMQGEISVCNTEEGACFKIELKII